MLLSGGRRIAAPVVAACLLGWTTGCASTHPPRPRPEETAQSKPAANEPTEAQRRAQMQYQVGVQYLQEGRTPEAIGALLQAVRLDPTDASAELALAEAYRRTGRLAEAEQHLLRALQLKPDYQQAHLNISALYIQLERYDQAIAHAQVLIADATFPYPWRALTNLGWAELQLGRLDAAAHHLGQALDYRAEYWPARLNLGILEAQRGNKPAAIQCFERVLEAQPGPLAEAEVRYRLAELQLALGERAAAIEQLTKATDLHPSGPWGKRSAEYLKSLQ